MWYFFLSYSRCALWCHFHKAGCQAMQCYLSPKHLIEAPSLCVSEATGVRFNSIYIFCHAKQKNLDGCTGATLRPATPLFWRRCLCAVLGNHQEYGCMKVLPSVGFQLAVWIDRCGSSVSRFRVEGFSASGWPSLAHLL